MKDIRFVSGPRSPSANIQRPRNVSASLIIDRLTTVSTVLLTNPPAGMLANLPAGEKLSPIYLQELL